MSIRQNRVTERVAKAGLIYLALLALTTPSQFWEVSETDSVTHVHFPAFLTAVSARKAAEGLILSDSDAEGLILSESAESDSVTDRSNDNADVQSVIDEGNSVELHGDVEEREGTDEEKSADVADTIEPVTIDALQEELEKTRRELERVTFAHSEMKHERDQLLQRPKHFSRSDLMIEDLKSQNKRLKEDAHAKATEAWALKGERDVAVDNLAKADEKAKMNAELKLVQIRQQLAATQSELDNVEERKKIEVDEKVQAVKDEFEKIKQGVEQDAMAVKKELGDKNKTVIQYMTKVKDLGREKAKLTQDNTELTEQNTRYATDLEEALRKVHAQEGRMADDIHALNHKLQLIDLEKQEVEKKLKTLGNEKKNLEDHKNKRIQQLEAAAEKAREMYEAQLAEKEDRISELMTKEKDDKSVFENTYDVLKAEKEALRVRLDANDQDMKKLKEKHEADVQRRESEFREQIEGVMNDVKTCEDTIKSQGSSKDAAIIAFKAAGAATAASCKAEIVESDIQCRIATSKLIKANESSLVELKDRIKGLTLSLEKERGEKKKIDSELSELRNDFGQCSKTLKDKISDLSELKKKYDAELKSKQDIQSAIEDLKSKQKEKISGQCEDHAVEIKQKSEAIEALKASLQDKEDKIKEIAADIQRITEQVPSIMDSITNYPEDEDAQIAESHKDDESATTDSAETAQKRSLRSRQSTMSTDDSQGSANPNAGSNASTESESESERNIEGDADPASATAPSGVRAVLNSIRNAIGV